MLPLSLNHSDWVAAGWALSGKRIGLRILVLVGLGAIAFAVLSLLSGCGSDSSPGGAVKGKNAPTATKSGTKPQAVSSVLIGQGETGPGKMGLVKKAPDYKGIEMVPGVTEAEIEAKVTTAREESKAPGFEVFPGITRQQLDAKVATAREEIESPGTEIFPEITRQQLDAKVAADLTEFYFQRSEIFPNMTLEQLNSKIAPGGKLDHRLIMMTKP